MFRSERWRTFSASSLVFSEICKRFCQTEFSGAGYESFQSGFVPGWRFQYGNFLMFIALLGMYQAPSVFILRDLLSSAVADWWSVTCNPIPESFGTNLRRWIYEEDFNFPRLWRAFQQQRSAPNRRFRNYLFRELTGHDPALCQPCPRTRFQAESFPTTRYLFFLAFKMARPLSLGRRKIVRCLGRPPIFF